MYKKVLTAKQITEKVQTLIDKLEEVVEDNVTVVVSTAYWHSPDSDGCNWNIGSVQNGSAYTDSIRKIIGGVRAEVNIVNP